MSPGDGLSIPLGYYHVANNVDYFMTLGINYYPTSYIDCVNEYNRQLVNNDSAVWSEAELLSTNFATGSHATSWPSIVETIRRIRESNAWVVRPPSLPEIAT